MRKSNPQPSQKILIKIGRRLKDDSLEVMFVFTIFLIANYYKQCLTNQINFIFSTLCLIANLKLLNKEAFTTRPQPNFIIMINC